MLKTRFRPSIRIGALTITLIVAILLGGGIGASIGALTIQPLYFANGNPNWAEVWTMRWNAGLFLAAAGSLVAASIAAFFAWRGVDTVLMTERLKRTEEQIIRFERDLQKAYNDQVVPGNDGIAIRQEVTAARMFSIKEDRDEMIDLINYVGWVVTLSDSRMLNDDLYFDRHGTAVVMIYVALKPLLKSMHEERLIDLRDLRRFAVRAFRHMTREGRRHVSLDDIRLSDTGDDLRAIRKSPTA